METISWAIFLETNYENGERERDKKKNKKMIGKREEKKEEHMQIEQQKNTAV
jgi:hypothetical protein